MLVWLFKLDNSRDDPVKKKRALKQSFLERPSSRHS